MFIVLHFSILHSRRALIKTEQVQIIRHKGNTPPYYITTLPHCHIAAALPVYYLI